MDDDFLTSHYPGASAARQTTRRQIRLANQPAAIGMRQPILMLGESGTGKGHLAEMISAHRTWLGLAGPDRLRYLSNREPLTLASYATVLLPGIPETLLESELFGHRKGAFTGADRDKPGIFASEGIKDLLLDEIGDASLGLQAKLLEVIESGVYRPVGAPLEDQKETSQRLLLATNRDLELRVRDGQFREDLYWRVAQLVIVVPPLREQREELRAIMGSVKNKVLAVLDVPLRDQLAAREFTEEDLAWANQYEWPGNIRELTRMVRLWLLLPHNARLSDVPTIFPVRRPAVDSVSAEEVIDRGVRQWWGEIVAGRRRPSGTVEHLVRDLTDLVRHALVRHASRPGDQRIAFPRQSRANVASRLSKWRKAAP